ncbi:glycosyltransferase family 2 protein [Candidatus Pelagibacter sp.]|jgi:dolichol-phosphate mannosyltransferase|nr:glycosyltransferase family 2 protein [Candidatus Pelagibacter sp.]|tara:strand:- start:997 stop:1683 length:687 start_codon:yes stop_codon:yes gene_type:complete
MKKITYVVLVWNEVKTIKKAIQDVESIKYSNKEIIVIDNNSTDGTVDILKKIKNIKIIYRKKNLGAGQSTLTGIKKAKGEYIYIQFSDLEYDHNRSIDMLNYAIKNNLDIVLGSRLKNKKSVYKLLLKKPAYLATILTTFLVNIFYKKNFTDIIGAKLYKTQTVKKIPFNSFHTGFDFEFISRACKRNLKIDEISIKYKARANSKDKKIKFYNIFNALYEIFKVKIFE